MLSFVVKGTPKNGFFSFIKSVFSNVCKSLSISLASSKASEYLSSTTAFIISFTSFALSINAVTTSNDDIFFVL